MIRLPFVSSFAFACSLAASAMQLGCMGFIPPGGLTKEQQQEMKRQQALQLDSVQTTMFVSGEAAWLCPTATAALAKTPCEGGRQVMHNRSVEVRGQSAKDGVWQAPDVTSPTPRVVYVAADQLAAAPVLREFDTFAIEVMQRYPEAKRVKPEKLTYVDMLYSARKHAGKYVVIRQDLRSMRGRELEDGKVSFTLPIPVYKGAKYNTDARFELRNASIVNEFKQGQRSYQCGTYCDEFVIVAVITDRVFETPNSSTAIKIPVLDIVELADRFGNYRAD